MGVARNTVYNWMGNANVPLNNLMALYGIGLDVLYVITGERGADALSEDEAELLESFRAAPLAVKAAAIGALQGGSASPGKIKQTVSAPAGQVAAGEVVTQTQGDVHVGGAGGKRKR